MRLWMQVEANTLSCVDRHVLAPRMIAESAHVYSLCEVSVRNNRRKNLTLLLPLPSVSLGSCVAVSSVQDTSSTYEEPLPDLIDFDYATGFSQILSVCT